MGDVIKGFIATAGVSMFWGADLLGIRASQLFCCTRSTFFFFFFSEGFGSTRAYGNADDVGDDGWAPSFFVFFADSGTTFVYRLPTPGVSL